VQCTTYALFTEACITVRTYVHVCSVHVLYAFDSRVGILHKISLMGNLESRNRDDEQFVDNLLMTNSFQKGSAHG
jgi:hypothetical protein